MTQLGKGRRERQAADTATPGLLHSPAPCHARKRVVLFARMAQCGATATEVHGDVTRTGAELGRLALAHLFGYLTRDIEERQVKRTRRMREPRRVACRVDDAEAGVDLRRFPGSFSSAAAEDVSARSGGNTAAIAAAVNLACWAPRTRAAVTGAPRRTALTVRVPLARANGTLRHGRIRAYVVHARPG